MLDKTCDFIIANTTFVRMMIAFLLWIAFCAWLFWKMSKPPEANANSIIRQCRKERDFNIELNKWQRRRGI